MSGTVHRSARSRGLLCSRVCHDLISPVGAIVNGLEVLEEEKDEETKTLRARPDQEERRHGLGQAAVLPHRLRRRRLRRRPDRPRRRRERSRAASWRTTRPSSPGICRARCWPKNRVKLLLNMLLIAGQAIPRGGTLTVDPIGAGDDHGLQGQRRRHQRQDSAGGAAAAGGRDRRRRRSTPTASSRSMPGCWPGPAASRPRMAMDGDAVVVSAQ